MSYSRRQVCHITTLHPRFDVRIYHKECKSLSEKYDVYLLVADGKGNQEIGNIKIIDAGERYRRRILRSILTSYRIYAEALKLKSDIFHFHDSDFLLFAWLLRLKGRKVIYDAHEDLPRQILGKEYIRPLLRPVISRFAEFIENALAGKFNAIVAATPAIERRFRRLNREVVTLANFPRKSEFDQATDLSEKQNRICYIGSISRVRGIYDLIRAIPHVRFDLVLDIAGDPEDQEILRTIKNADFINYIGIVDRSKIIEILKRSKIGIVTLQAVPNHVESYPVKMFEYMAAGIPVIASDFPLWKEIVVTNNCGICVNPTDHIKIADSINRLLANPSEAKIMGTNGRKQVAIKFNWESQSEKLFALYSKILKK